MSPKSSCWSAWGLGGTIPNGHTRNASLPSGGESAGERGVPAASLAVILSQSRSQQAFSVKGQIVNVLGLVGSMVSTLLL